MNSKQTWQALLEIIRTGPEFTDQDGRVCRELLDQYITIDDGNDAIDLVRIMQRQTAWVYPSPEELKNIILASQQGAHEYSYGPRLFGSTNQIDSFIIPLLRENPKTRRALAILYNPATDSRLASKNVPGLASIHFRMLGELHMTCHVRSSDVFIGFPANAYQMRCLQDHVAEKLGVKSGPMHFFLSSAHYFAEYNVEYEAVERTLKKQHKEP